MNQNIITFEKPTLFSPKLNRFTAVQHILTQRNLYGPAFGSYFYNHTSLGRNLNIAYITQGIN